MNVFDVRVYGIRRRADRRRPFEVRWHAAGRARSRSFITRGLADSYRAELVRAARQGLEFGPATGEPVLWGVPPVPAITWYQHAVAFVHMKWPCLAPHSRASMAEALATVTPALIRRTASRPPARTLRAVLYGHVFNPHRRHATLDPAAEEALGWLERASLPIQQLRDPRVTRLALDALAVRLDGHPAAANTVARKRAVFHDALGYAAELGLLPVNPLSHVRWKAAKNLGEASQVTVASPAQVRAILAEVGKARPELTAFFACLYYAALRPEEAVALREDNLDLPGREWGKLILTGACPRTGSAWTSTGKPYEPRGLKHRPDGAIRAVPIPPVLVTLLRQHLQNYGTTPDGRLFRGTRGGMLSESVYGRAWHTARRDALGPVLATTGLARRPYDLRHAALSLWLTATSAPAEIAARAGNSTCVLYTTYTHRLHGHQDAVSQQIEHALNQQNLSPSVTASGPAHRSQRPNPVRYMSVNGPHQAAHQHPCGARTPMGSHPQSARLRRSCLGSGRPARGDTAAATGLIWPTHGPQAVYGTACFPRTEPVTRIRVTGADLGF